METIETVTTPDLQNGDIVLHYGAHFVLSGKRLSVCHPIEAACYVFEGKPTDISEVYAPMLGVIRRDGAWTFQGNARAHWQRVTR